VRGGGVSEKAKSHIVWLGSSEKLQSREGIRVEARRGALGNKKKNSFGIVEAKTPGKGS